MNMLRPNIGPNFTFIPSIESPKILFENVGAIHKHIQNAL